MNNEIENKQNTAPRRLSDLDLIGHFSVSTMVLAQKVILPEGAAEYGFADAFHNTLRIDMDTAGEISAIVVNDKLATAEDLQELTEYVDYAKEFPEDRLNFDLLGLLTTGKSPENSVFTVDKSDPSGEVETWFYSFHSQTRPRVDCGSFYNATENDVRIGCRGAYGAVFEESIPARTWIDVSDPLEIAAFERAYAGNGPIAEVPEREETFDLMR